MRSQERVGTLVKGKYRIHAILGEGGMGAVFAAENEQLRRPVAIKFLLAHLADNASIVTRFVNEARTASALRHPNVVDVLDVDLAEDGTPFLVMEMLTGRSLAAHLGAVGRMSAAQSWDVLAPAMSAIALAHARGVVHRDLKPDNIFLHEVDGRVTTKVVDFGIAKVASGTAADLTGTGAVLGTAAYMAPEQARGGNVGPWTDVWAVGTIWFECLAGVLPYDFGRDIAPTAAMVRIVTEKPRPIRAVLPDVPLALAAVVDGALAHDVSARPANMTALLELGTRAMASPAADVRSLPPTLLETPAVARPGPVAPVATTGSRGNRGALVGIASVSAVVVVIALLAVAWGFDALGAARETRSPTPPRPEHTVPPAIVDGGVGEADAAMANPAPSPEPTAAAPSTVVETQPTDRPSCLGTWRYSYNDGTYAASMTATIDSTDERCGRVRVVEAGPAHVDPLGQCTVEGNTLSAHVPVRNYTEAYTYLMRCDGDSARITLRSASGTHHYSAHRVAD